MFAIPIFILLVLLSLVAFHIITRYSRKGKLALKIPGLYAFPFVGNLLYFNYDCAHQMWEKIRWTSNKYYPITRLWYARSAVISIRHPDDVEILLSSQKVIEKGYVYNHLHPWLKTGLLTSTGTKWRQRRKILTNAFHFNILKKYLNVISEQSEKSVKNLKAEGPETTKEVVEFTAGLTLNVICESAMGIALDTIDKKIVAAYKKAIHDFGYVVVYRIPRPYILDWMLKPFWKIGRMQRDSLKILHEFTDKVVKERRAYHASNKNKDLAKLHSTTDIQADTEQKKKLPMLDLLLAAEQDGLIDDEGIREEVDTFTFEGHDTTGIALTFSLLLLAANKEVQDRARTEVTEIFEKNGKELQMSDLAEFSYLEQCIKEAMRLYPPVATIFRYTREDLQLKHALIPGGLHIMVHLYDLHRDPNFWPDPEKFDPDRFLPENTKNRHPFSYVPFSAGPRNCIGQKFAMMEMKMSIARILYDFYLEPVDRLADVKLVADLVIRPRDPASIKFVRIRKD